MLRAAIAGDTREEARIDAAFHARIIDIAGNGTLGWVWRHLEPVSRTQITFEIPGVDPRQIASLHQPILDALRLGDAAAAQDAIRCHFAVIRAVFDELFVDPAGPASGHDMTDAPAMILGAAEA
jgi:DNA-binding GntR family transcriptional regulator